MKLNELKHNHSLTDLLKILIFSILMLTPLLSIATRCFYVICNKNAYQSYNGNVTEKNYIELTTDKLPIYDIYYNFQYDSNLPSSDARIYFDNLEIIDTNITTAQKDSLMNTPYISFWFTTTYNASYITWQNLGTNLPSTNTVLYLKFNILSISNNLVNNDTAVFTKKDSNSLDNVFEYSISQLENSDYYNWTQNTTIYTGVKAMTTNLQIEGNVIPILITYWFLLTVIYVIIDIVLKCFTTLTHLIGNKKA